MAPHRLRCPEGLTVATTVVLDTNAMLLPFTEGTRLEEGLEALFDEVDLVVPSCVRMELQQIATRSGGNSARHAKTAAKLAEHWRNEPTKLTGDDGILEVARTGRVTIARGNQRAAERGSRQAKEKVA